MVHRDQTWRFGFTVPEHRRDEAKTRYTEAILSLDPPGKRECVRRVGHEDVL
jgi:hypothetical protein